MTIRKQILVYVANQLQQVPDATVYRSRQEALSREEGTGIVVQPDEEEPENRAGGGPQGLVLRNFTFVIVVVARAQGAPAAACADDVADPVIESVQGFITADTTLGGLCATVIEGPTKWDFEEADGTAVSAEMSLTARYETRRSSLSA